MRLDIIEFVSAGVPNVPNVACRTGSLQLPTKYPASQLSFGRLIPLHSPRINGVQRTMVKRTSTEATNSHTKSRKKRSHSSLHPNQNDLDNRISTATTATNIPTNEACLSLMNSLDVLQLIVSFVGPKQYRLVASIHTSFRMSYDQSFPDCTTTLLNVSNIRVAKFCADGTLLHPLFEV